MPLSKIALDVIDKLPRGNAGPYLFSYNGGKTPLRITSKIKRDLDRRMILSLKALARRRGEDPRAVRLQDWVNHDLRRTIRSALSALRVPQNVAESVLGHVQPGIVGVYDVHSFIDEKREVLEYGRSISTHSSILIRAAVTSSRYADDHTQDRQAARRST